MLVQINLYIFFFASTIVSYISAPLIKFFGEKFNIYDIPNNRKVHTKPIIRIGGLSISITFFALFLLINNFYNSEILSDENTKKLTLILIGAGTSLLIGLHDDIFKSSAFFRLSLQFIVALIISFNGINFPDFSLYLPFVGTLNIILPTFLSNIFGAIWIVSITNGINWIDGIDGLAAGFSLLLTIGLLSLMIVKGSILGVLFFVALGGAIFGFLIRNFKPAYYIMGDCGSNFLGFILSSSSLMFLNQVNNNFIPIYSLLLIFSLPIVDMFFAISNRILENKSIFKADKSHIHHKLIALNFSYEKIIFLLYFYSFISILIGIFYLRNI